jgi:hypothetical protein
VCKRKASDKITQKRKEPKNEWETEASAKSRPGEKKTGYGGHNARSGRNTRSVEPG